MNHRSLTDQSISSGGVDAVVAQLQAQTNALLTLSATGGTLTADGTEQTLFITNEPLGCWHPIVLWLDLDNMDQGDTIVVRIYVRIRDAGILQLWHYATYTGVDGGLENSVKLVAIPLYPNRHGLQITLRQTGGTNCNYDWELHAEA